MRNCGVILAALTAGLALVDAGQAQYTMPASTSVSGGGAGRSTGGFVSGFTPTNIVNQPVNIGGAVKPINFQQTVMPQQQSTKVFDINSAFSKVQMPLFKSTPVSTPIMAPGPGNPLQPVANPKLKAPQPAANQQRRYLLGVMPWY